MQSLLAQHADCIANLQTLKRSKRRTHELLDSALECMDIGHSCFEQTFLQSSSNRQQLPSYDYTKNSIIVFLLSELLKESFFDFRFFHESVSPGPLSIPWGPFRIFTKICGDFRNKRLSTVSTTMAIIYRRCRHQR